MYTKVELNVELTGKLYKDDEVENFKVLLDGIDITEKLDEDTIDLLKEEFINEYSEDRIAEKYEYEG